MPPRSSPDSDSPEQTDYDQLLKTKLASGLSEADAKEVVAAQKRHDESLAKAAKAKPAKSES
jgi:hypothetical protein